MNKKKLCRVIKIVNNENLNKLNKIRFGGKILMGLLS